jgi:hypothetical protein
VLFFFDHTVSSQLAQTGDDVKVRRPAAYAYDLMLLALLTASLGLMGMPPVNGVIPQAPMHARALRGLALRLRDRRLETPRGDSEKSDVAGADSDVGDASNVEQPMNVNFASRTVGDTQQHHADHILVLEQRGSNLVQAVLVGLCVPAAPVTSLLPTSVLWGYFAFMALESLQGDNGLIKRVIFMMMDRPARAQRMCVSTALDRVPGTIIDAFTVLQVVALLGIWAMIAFGGIGGIAFPIPILLLLPLRAYVLPRIFGEKNIHSLDPAPYDGLDDDVGSSGCNDDGENEFSGPRNNDEPEL